MWDRYAARHSGMCLVFDRARLTEEITGQLAVRGELHAERVIYGVEPFDIEAFFLNLEAIRHHGEDNAMEQHVLKHWRDLFLRKAKYWEHEREFRWIFREGVPARAFVKFNDALRGIVVGDAFNESDYDVLAASYDLASLVRSPPPIGRTSRYVRRMRWINGTPSSGFVDI
jgi:hypothetical protein